MPLLIYKVYKEDFALNNLRGLICHKTLPAINIALYICIVSFLIFVLVCIVDTGKRYANNCEMFILDLKKIMELTQLMDIHHFFLFFSFFFFFFLFPMHFSWLNHLQRIFIVKIIFNAFYSKTHF